MNKSDITKVTTAWFLEACSFVRGKGWLIRAIQGGDISRWSGENNMLMILLLPQLLDYVNN